MSKEVFGGGLIITTTHPTNTGSSSNLLPAAVRVVGEWQNPGVVLAGLSSIERDGGTPPIGPLPPLPPIKKILSPPLKPMVPPFGTLCAHLENNLKNLSQLVHILPNKGPLFIQISCLFETPPNFVANHTPISRVPPQYGKIEMKPSPSWR